MSATLLYTQPMMFMFTVLPLRRVQRRVNGLRSINLCSSVMCYFQSMYNFMICWQCPYQSSHAQLKAKHQIQLLSFEPVDCICVLGYSQGLSSNTDQEKKQGRGWGGHVSHVIVQDQRP